MSRTTEGSQMKQITAVRCHVPQENIVLLVLVVVKADRKFFKIISKESLLTCLCTFPTRAGST